MAHKQHTCLQSNKRSKNNAANWTKTDVFWQEKPARHGVLFCSKNTTSGATSLFQNHCIRYQGIIYRTTHIAIVSCVSQPLASAIPVTYTNSVCSEGLNFSAFHFRGNWTLQPLQLLGLMTLEGHVQTTLKYNQGLIEPPKAAIGHATHVVHA